MSKAKIIFSFFLLPFLISILINFIFSFSASAQTEETLSITTYYPAPYGVYNETRAKRMAIGDNWFNATSYCWAADPSCVPDNIQANADLVVEGNVGIGTRNPNGPLDIQGNTSITGQLIRLTNTRDLGANIISPVFTVNASIPSLSIDYTSLVMTAGGAIKGYNRTGSLTIHIDPYAAANSFFNTSGSVGIGTNSPDPAYKLHVAGDVGATAYWYTSDERLKTNIQPTPGLDIIKQLRGVSFNWKESGHQSAGLLAQDVERALPQAVATDVTGTKSLNYGALTAPIVESIKELKAAGDDKDERLRTLEAEVSGLKRQIEQFKAKGAQR